MRKFLIAAAVAAAVSTTPAYAATIIVPQDNSSPGAMLSFTGSPAMATAQFGASYSVDNTSFVDTFYFTLGQSATLTSGQLLTEAGGSFPYKGDLDISLVNLMSGSSTLFTFGASASPPGTDKNELFSIPAANLNQLFGPGTYSLSITGFADNVSASTARGGAGPGSYSGSLNFTAANVTAAVPEPATWAMMMLGFGMIGFGMRRRRAAPKINYAFA